MAVGVDVSVDLFWRSIEDGHLPSVGIGKWLEVGCAEYDWRTSAEAAWPKAKIYGLDWRSAPNAIRGDVLDRQLFAGWTFDWIVAISTIEHIGLGHYGDPIHEWGDQVAMRNIWHWLKPGGYCWFDVPYGDRYLVQGTKHRIYNDAALEIRLELPQWKVLWSGVETGGGHTVKGFWVQKT